MAEIIINDANCMQHLWHPAHGTKPGGQPRDYVKMPFGSLKCAKPFDLPLIDPSEYADRLAQRIKDKAQLSDVRNQGMNGKPIPSRDQDGYGYCWAHSSTSAMMLARALMGEPYADLSAFAVACVIKDFRDEGGFGAESLEFIAERGVPTSDFWPQQGTKRSYDNPTTWANASLHKYIQWRDLDSNNMKAQLITCLLMGFPVVTDFNWWSHSVCTMDLVSLNPFQTRILNSWGDSWSDNGAGILEGSKAIPDDALVALVATPSTK